MLGTLLDQLRERQALLRRELERLDEAGELIERGLKLATEILVEPSRPAEASSASDEPAGTEAAHPGVGCWRAFQGRPHVHLRRVLGAVHA